jgi:hypothetical protein
MAAPFNADLITAFSQLGSPFTMIDDVNASLAVGATSQAAGYPARGEMIRVTQSVLNGSVVLPSLTTGEAPRAVFIVNDSPNSITVGGSAGDKVGGVATTATFGAGVQAVTTLNSVLFVASVSPTGVGGVPTVSPNNWHPLVGTGT